MSEPVLIDQLADDIWNIYIADAKSAETHIEDFLSNRLGGFSSKDRQEILSRLSDQYRAVPDNDTRELLLDNRIMARVFSLLLGKDVSSSLLPASELIQKLAESLNTIFDSMNLLIGIINKTLYGRQPGRRDDDKTIRQVIGSHLSGGVELTSLEAHLKQISRAFLTSHQAFKTSVHATMQRVLEEIDPEFLEAETDGGFTFGAFRKARSYDAYKDNYGQIKKWFESDRFMEDFLREFEKHCQELKDT